MKKYLDSSLPARERAKDLLGRMSLDEKMGQITGFMPFPGEMEQLEKKHPHGVGAVSCLWMMGFECIEEAAGFQKNIQKKGDGVERTSYSRRISSGRIIRCIAPGGT